MEAIEALAQKVTQRLGELAARSAVVSEPIAVAGRYVIPLCELSLAVGSGGGVGQGDGEEPGGAPNRGQGGGAGGAAKTTPVALLIIDENGARLEALGA